VETCGEAARAAADIRVREHPAPEAVVVDKKIAASRDEFLKEVDERFASHGWIMTERRFQVRPDVRHVPLRRSAREDGQLLDEWRAERS
jgi:hypothetical protein